MGKKDSKAAKEAKKARGAEKAAKAKAKASSKSKKEAAKYDSDGDDDDIDTILAEYARKQEEFERVVISTCSRPSRRQNATLVASPQPGRRDLLLFGGENIEESGLDRFYNDLFVYSVDTDQWRKVSSPNSPLARCGHAMCPHPSGVVIVHGGEFSSPKQTTFHHYGDTWVLDANTKEWMRVDAKPAPSPRSGHRMCIWKNYVLLFGGFRDLGTSTAYLDDLWAFDVQEYKWHKIEIPGALAKPDARSGHSFLGTPEGAVLVGGYSKVKAPKGQQRGKTHVDSWILRMKGDLQGVRWERRKRGAYAPSPRIGCSMVPHRGRGVLFGGVYDTDETEEELRSVFYNQLYSYNVETNRWFALTLRPPRKNPNSAVPSSAAKKNSGDRDSDLHKTLQSLQIDISDMVSDSDSEDEDAEQLEKPQYPVNTKLPHARFNATLAVLGDTLYILNGVWENGEQEFPLDSLYSIDLARLDGVTVYWENLGLEAAAHHSDDSDFSGDDDGSGDEDEDEDDEAQNDDGKLENEANQEEEEEEEIQEEIPDPRPWLPHPKPFESVTAFYRKHVDAFVDWALKSSPDARGKDLKRTAFELAQTRWWERREAVTVTEDQFEELGGVDDIVERNRAGPTKRR